MPKKIRPSGGYRKTASFQTATIIYDATYWFCGKFCGIGGLLSGRRIQRKLTLFGRCLNGLERTRQISRVGRI